MKIIWLLGRPQLVTCGDDISVTVVGTWATGKPSISPALQSDVETGGPRCVAHPTAMMAPLVTDGDQLPTTFMRMGRHVSPTWFRQISLEIVGVVVGTLLSGVA